MFKVRQRNFNESEERENKRWNRSSNNSEGSVYKTYLNDFIKNLQYIAGENIKIIDRTGLILDLFTKHAKTKEAKTQVELAQLEYFLPRLTRQWTHLERQMGGIGTRAGAGEAQIEIDRRLIRNKLSRLKSSLKAIEKQRNIQRNGREHSYRIALVGYTNAG